MTDDYNRSSEQINTNPATQHPEGFYSPGEAIMYVGETAEGSERHAYDELQRYVSDRHLIEYGWLTPQQLDRSKIYLPPARLQHRARLTRLVRMDLSVLAWWGSPFSKDPDANTALQVRGNLGADQIWRLFNLRQKELAEQFKHRDCRPTLTGKRQVIV